MNIALEQSSMTSIKQTAKANLKSQYSIPKNISFIGIIAITDIEKRDFLVRGLSEIGLSAIVLGSDEIFGAENIFSALKINMNSLAGFDFFIYDNEHDGVDVVKFMSAGIVPIMPEKNTFSGILKDFNPMRFEGNGFFYKRDSSFCIFEKVIAYIENIKFPEDKRVLMKNVISAF
ncbi:MAG: hypothetical protein PHS92_02825 [Candidatus Gracilibacteria bacterium]|nr:hypothetical protein [Candidatus Gracilibacteria bacterium]